MLRTVVLWFALSGCSFVLVSGPPANHQQLPAFDCTTSRLGPALDTVWTILQALNLSVALSKTNQEWDDQFGGSPPFSRTTAVPVYIALAGLGAAGMYYGFSRTGECREAKTELAGRQAQPNGTGVQPGTWPPPNMPGSGQPYPPAPGQPAPGYPPAQPAPGQPAPGYPPAQPTTP